MATWRIEAGPAVSAPTTQLTKATGRKLSFKLTEPSTFAFSVDGRSDQALDLVDLATDVHCTRNNAVLYTGRLLTTTDDFDDATHTVQASCTDVKGLLARRPVMADRNWVDLDAAVAFETLMVDAQSGTNTSLGITVTDLGGAGVTVDREMAAGAPILGELQAIQGGTEGAASVFDWDVTPGWSDRRPQFWSPRRGRDLTGLGGVVLDYTYRVGANGRLIPRSSPVAKVSRAFDPSTYANAYFITGGIDTITVSYPATEVGADGIERPITINYSYDVPTTPIVGVDGATVADIGTWSTTEGYPDIKQQPALQAKAEQRAADLKLFTPTYTVVLKDGWWEGPGHVWLGDTIRLIINSGRLQEDASLRITGVDIDLGDSGEETVTLTVGPTRRTEISTLIAHQRRLATLERTPRAA